VTVLALVSLILVATGHPWLAVGLVVIAGAGMVVYYIRKRKE
jgi:hypothetical protein